MPNDQPSVLRRTDLVWLLLLWFAAIAAINPLGDFPLNDDWAYAHNTRALAVDNRLFFSDWPAMTLFAHTLWGAGFCKVFGFSFTVLRFSTLLMGALGLAGFFRWLQWLEIPRHMAWAAWLLLAFNPLWFVLANSYMTDVPFLAVSVWCCLILLQLLENPSLRLLAVATALALWACFIRQLGLIAPFVFMLLFFRRHSFSLRNTVFAALPFALSYVSLQIFNDWLKRSGQLPESYRGIEHLWQFVSTMSGMVPITVERLGLLLATSGLFLLPLVLVQTGRIFGRNTWTGRMLPVRIALLLAASFCIWKGHAVFPQGNVFYNIGLGPKLLADAIWGDNADPQLVSTGLETLKRTAALAGLLLTVLLLSPIHSEGRQRLAMHFSRLFCLLYAAFICLNPLLIDRYFLVLMPFFLLMLCISRRTFPRAGFVLAALPVLFSIAATHDYLAWNRARWQLGNSLTEQGISPEKVDGGFEFNAWHLYRYGAELQRTQHLKSWWFVRDDEWLISFGPAWGFDVVQTIPFQRWLPPGADSIYLNRRKPFVVVDSVLCGMERLSPDSTAFLPEAGHWQPGGGRLQSDEKVHSGRYALRLDAAQPYGGTILFDNFQRYERFVISVWRFPAKTETSIVFSCDDASRGYFTESQYAVARDSAGWEKLEFILTIPQAMTGKSGRFYLWNPSQNEKAWVDDLCIYRLYAR